CSSCAPIMAPATGSIACNGRHAGDSAVRRRQGLAAAGHRSGESHGRRAGTRSEGVKAMAIELTPFDPAAHLADDDAQAGFLSEALATADAGYIAHANGVIARARGMSGLAAETGLKRQQL